MPIFYLLMRSGANQPERSGASRALLTVWQAIRYVLFTGMVGMLLLSAGCSDSGNVELTDGSALLFRATEQRFKQDTPLAARGALRVLTVGWPSTR